jgi:hypothetical protein
MKLLKIARIVVVFAVLVSTASCSEFIEEDISDETVTIIGPVDTVIAYSTITFWWEPVDGATAYRLQLIAPSVSNPVKVALDTLVTGTEFNYTPDVGEYEWRMRAENSAYTSQYTEPRVLVIQESDDISKVDLTLRSPSNNLVTSDTLVRFSWDRVIIATNYELHLEGGDLLLDTTLTSNSFQIKLPSDEVTYFWEVKAVNDISSTLSPEFKFTIDRNAPSAPALQTPATDSAFAIANPVRFTWLRDAGVAVDSFLIEKKQNDDTWALLSGFAPRKVSAPEITLSKTDFNNATTSDSYRWSVISIDKAGNKSEPSRRAFTIGSL